MSLVPSLLQAIVRVDGEALVMHVGEKPYVVSPNGQIDLATRGLTFDAVNGLVAQLLPPDAMKSLEEVGATQFELPPFDEFPGEHFTVTAARGGDDVWAEIRRRPAHDDDLVAVDLFAGFTAPEAVAPPPAADDLVLPGDRQLWPPRPSDVTAAPAPPALTPPEAAAPAPAPAPPAPPALALVPPASTASHEAEVVAEATPAEPVVPPVVETSAAEMRAVEMPAAAMPAAEITDAQEPVATVSPVVHQPEVAAPPVVPEPVAASPIVDEPLGDEPIGDESPAASPVVVDLVAPSPAAAETVAVPLVIDEPVAAERVSPEPAAPEPIALSPSMDDAPAPATPSDEPPVAVAPGPVEPHVEPVPAVSQAAIANWLAEFATAAILHKPDTHAVASHPAPPVSPAPIEAPVDTPAEPAVSVHEPEPESAPVFVTLSAPPSVEARAADRESEADMSIPPQGIQPIAPATPSPVASAPDAFTSRVSSVEPVPALAPLSELPLPAAPRAASFVPFPSLADQSQAAVVLPIGRGVREVAMDEQAAAGLERLVRLAASRGATALYLSSGARPSVRLDGDVQTLDGTAPQTAAEIDALLLGVAPDAAMQARAGGNTEWVWQLDDVGSVRCASFRDHRGPGAVFRIVAARPQSVAQLGLSREVQALAAETEGLVLVSGPRANGKSTLVSSLVDFINRTRRDYVITIESEVNVVHERQGAFVSQREVRGGSDEALAAARAALREDPDVLVIDDLRTAGLMSVALDAAANGQLVIGGVPAHHASGAIERLIDVYQPEQRRQVQLAIAQNLRGVVSQVLLRKSGGGRVAAREVLLNTPIVASLLAEGRLNQLPMAIEGGRKSGMVPMNDALVGFVQSGAVDVRDAYRRAADRAGLLDLLKRQGIDTSVVERLA